MSLNFKIVVKDGKIKDVQPPAFASLVTLVQHEGRSYVAAPMLVDTETRALIVPVIRVEHTP